MYERNVFVNCAFDAEYAPLLEAMLFTIVSIGLTPRLANERLENGENRFSKIVGLARASKFSVHDLSRSKARVIGEDVRMNMPFELGVDFGIRLCSNDLPSEKKFLIFERDPYDLKRALSDINGQDVEAHRNDYQNVIKKVRDFFRVEGQMDIAGAMRLKSDYETFQGWLLELKLSEGHSQSDALSLPTAERLDAMKHWIDIGKPLEIR